MQIVRKNVRRVGLLTEQEKINIRSENMNKKTLSKLHRKLKKRLEGYTEDLRLIANSKQLEAWRATNKTLLERLDRADFIASMQARTTYLVPINYFTKKGKKYYWLDYSKKYQYDYEVEKNKILVKIITPRIFDPDFALRKIKRNLGGETKRKLKLAVEHHILLTDKDNAISETQLDEKLKHKGIR